MERPVRSKRQRAIVISSDSEDEPKNASLDRSYEPDSPKKPGQKRKKTLTAGNVKVKVEKGDVSVKKPATTRKRKQAETTTTAVQKSKRQKIVPKKEEDASGGEEEGATEVKQEADDIVKRNDKKTIDFGAVTCKEWTESEYISETNSIERRIAENIIKLFTEENTIPFIARYRKNVTGGMGPDQLRAVKESYDQAKLIKQRATTILKSIDKLGQWTPEVHSAIKSTKSLDDLEHIYSIFKPASKRSLAERAKELGLGPISECILQGNDIPHLASLIDPKKEGLKNEQQVKEGIVHIIADAINKNKEVFDKVKELQKTCNIEIQTVQCKTTDSSKAEASKDGKRENEEKKYEMYYNFSINERNIKPHHILAINRGEAQKILSVKVNLPDFLERQFKRICTGVYRAAFAASKFHAALMNDSLDYAYKKLIKPLVTRRVRSEMKTRAELASIEVFATNVKQLLLTPPVRGKIVLGIDPGYYHGCKLAVVSEQGNVLETGVIYPHKKSEASHRESAETLIGLIKKHKCTILALGNATACRETELFLSKLIKSDASGLSGVSYAIVDESGASIYSCSSEAKSEFPGLDPNLISAVSIARRLQDPLAELVKVEPKHLGVGMYQHDLPEKQLSQSLNEVVSEAVSFVGVDVNTASHCLLKRVAGLNVSRANSILDWRVKNGPFRNREQLLNVKGIGSKTFEQCAGFIRIIPETALTVASGATKAKRAKGSAEALLNPLDQTWIHPESYSTANEFVGRCQCDLNDLGTVSFIERINAFAEPGYEALADRFSTDATTIEIIVKGLSMRKDEDIRLKENYPLFRNSVLSINELNTGTVLTGAVRNVTHFGAFVDIGVGRDGLIHVKHLKNETLNVGQRVEVKVLSVEPARNRIGLQLIRVL